jgi:hypothetical protein
VAGDPRKPVEAVGPRGETLGYLTAREAALCGLPIQEVEPDQGPLIDHPYLAGVAEAARSRGVLSGDLNDVQGVLLDACRFRDRREEARREERRFEDLLSILRPEEWARWRERRDAEEAAKGAEDGEVDVVWAAPKNPGELAEALSGWGDGGGDDSPRAVSPYEGEGLLEEMGP